MRIAYLGNFNDSWSTENYIARALVRAGCEVHPLDETSAMNSPVQQLMLMGEGCGGIPYDLFLFAKGKFGGDWDISARTIREFIADVRQHRLAKKIVSWSFDCLNPEFNIQRYNWACRVSDATDLFLTTDGSIVDQITRAKVLRQGVPDDVRPGVFRNDLACDVLFLGDIYGKRREWLEPIQRHFNRRLWTIWGGYRGDILNDVMASAKVVLGPPWPSFPGYWSNRIYVVTGYGGFFLGHVDKRIYEEGWSLGTEFIPCCSLNPVDIINEIETYISWEPRFGIRDAGTKFARANHTYDHRVARLLEWIA